MEKPLVSLLYSATVLAFLGLAQPATANPPVGGGPGGSGNSSPINPTNPVDPGIILVQPGDPAICGAMSPGTPPYPILELDIIGHLENNGASGNVSVCAAPNGIPAGTAYVTYYFINNNSSNSCMQALQDALTTAQNIAAKKEGGIPINIDFGCRDGIQ